MPIDLKELKEFLATDEGKSALKEHVDAAVEEVTKGLKTKNSELLGSLKETKDKLKTIEKEKEDAEHEALTKTGDVEKIKESLRSKHEKELKEREEKITKLSGQLETHVIGEGLTQALVKAKVAAPLMDAAKALIKSSFKGEVGDNDGKPFAKFDGKAVDEFVTGWVQSEAGKHFVSASSNSGGGSQGANGSGKAATGKTMTRSEFDGLSAVEKSKASIEGVKLVNDAQT